MVNKSRKKTDNKLRRLKKQTKRGGSSPNELNNDINNIFETDTSKSSKDRLNKIITKYEKVDEVDEVINKILNKSVEKNNMSIFVYLLSKTDYINNNLSNVLQLIPKFTVIADKPNDQEYFIYELTLNKNNKNNFDKKYENLRIILEFSIKNKFYKNLKYMIQHFPEFMKTELIQNETYIEYIIHFAIENDIDLIELIIKSYSFILDNTYNSIFLNDLSVFIIAQ